MGQFSVAALGQFCIAGNRTIHVEALAVALASLGRWVREAIDRAADAGDMATSDLFTEICRDIDQQLWLVEAHLRTQT